MEEVVAKDAGELPDTSDKSEDNLAEGIIGSTEHICEDDAPVDVESLNLAAQQMEVKENNLKNYISPA